jgi:hypothetical protein
MEKEEWRLLGPTYRQEDSLGFCNRATVQLTGIYLL